jgi:hypothetical protein
MVAWEREAEAGRNRMRVAVRDRFMALVALAACAAVMIWVVNGNAAGKAAAKPDFKKMDTNGDAKITVTEFDAFVVAYPELGLTRSVFQRWDRDSDGTVTLEEYDLYKPMEEKAAPAKKEIKVKKAAE